MTNPNPGELLITRRMALATLATLPTALLTKVQTGPLTPSIAEEFLMQAATSITTCWHLLRGDGLATVEYTLPKYVSLLTMLVKHASPYQQRAAYLASQGYLLLSLIALHRLRFAERVAQCQHAVTYANQSGDQTLLVTAYTHLGDAFYTNGQPEKMLHTYQHAEESSRSPRTPAFLRSKVLAELAHAYAQQGMRQEVLHCLGEARTIFIEENEDIPVFLSTDYGLFQLILFEGLSMLGLGTHEAKHRAQDRARSHYREAEDKLSKIEHLPQTVIVPDRINVEIVNQRARASIGAENLDAFERYLLKGIQGAKQLSSEKRRQEAIANWKMAREQWAHEKKIVELADALF